MNVSAFCIRHPVATILMSLALIAGGVFSYGFLPLAALPRTEFPVVNVSAQLPGASPQTMATSVATPLIKQFATIAGIDTITSSSTQGNTSVAIQFVLDRNIDASLFGIRSKLGQFPMVKQKEVIVPLKVRWLLPAWKYITAIFINTGFSTFATMRMHQFYGQGQPNLDTNKESLIQDRFGFRHLISGFSFNKRVANFLHDQFGVKR